jgi:hypothetical protein
MASIHTGPEGSRLQFGDGLPFGHEVVAATAGSDPTELARQLRLTRAAVVALKTSDNPDDINRAELINARFQEERVGAELSDIALANWHPRLLNALPRATNSQLQQFCEWNVQRQTARQDALASVAPMLHDEAVERAEHLVDIGFFPKQAVELFKGSITKGGDPYMLDSFESGGSQANGYFYPEDGRIGLANLFQDPTNFYGMTTQLRQVNFHERFLAAVSAAHGGFYEGLTGPRSRVPFLEEAIVSHGTQVAFSPRQLPEVLMPSNRLDGENSGSYVAVREFVGALARDGLYPFEAEQLSTSVFSPVGRSIARKDLRRKLEGNFRVIFPEQGDYALSKATSDYESTPHQHRPELMDQWAVRLYRALGYEVLEEDEAGQTSMDVIALKD